jgi:hypothetical protein
MKRRLTALSVLALVAVAALAVSSTLAASGGRSATGSGQFELTSTAGVSALRTFAFEANGSSDGTATGQAEVKNRAVDQRFHIEIDCLNVIGTIAVMSGTITSASGEGISVGDTEIFAAQDNGEGSLAAPDRVTRAFQNTGLVCTDITPANIGLYANLLNDVEQGNVQIR